MKRKVGIQFTVLVICVSLLLAACSKGGRAGGNNLTGENRDIKAGQSPEWIYVPEVITVEDEHADYGRMQLVNNTFCYVQQEGETEDGVKNICRYSLTSHKLTSVPIDWPEGGENWDAGAWYFDRDYNVYLTANVYPADYSSMTRFLCKFDQEGNCLFEKDITEQLGRGALLSGMTVDSQGRLFIFANGGEILLYTGDGAYHGSVSCGFPEDMASVQIIGACDGADGKYYICVSKENANNRKEDTEEMDRESRGCALMEIDFEGIRLSEAAGNLPDIRGFCPGRRQGEETAGQGGNSGQQYDFLLYDEKSVYGFNLAVQKNNEKTAQEEMLVFMDCNINGYCVSNLYLTEDENLCATVEDWDNEDRAIVMLKRMKAKEAPQREELVLVTVDGESDLSAAAVKFNRGDSRYHITVINFESLTDLYNAVLTGETVDLIDLSGINVQKLASQGFFEDLTSYVDQSEAFGRSDFVDGILDIYTFDNVLAGIPASFTLRTVIGSRERQKNQSGLTLEELLTASGLQPQAHAFDGMTKEEMMQYLMMFNEDTFIDWDAGTCHFDSEVFIAVLEYVNQYPDSVKENAEEPSLPVKIRNGEVLYAAHQVTYVSPEETTIAYGPESSKFDYMKRDLMPYVLNAFVPFQDERYNADLYSTEAQLSFMTRGEAFDKIQNALKESDIEIDAAYICYALDHETMLSQEYHEDMDGNIDRTQYKPQWSEADDCYYFYINQTYKGLPLYYAYGAFEDAADRNTPIRAVVSGEGIEWLNIEKVFMLSEKQDSVSLADMDAVVKTAADKYNQVSGNASYEITKAQLYYYVDLSSGAGTYDVKPVWILTGSEKDGKIVQTIIDAQNAEEVVHT